MGPLLYDETHDEVFLGRAAAVGSKHTSDDTAKKIDEEIRRIIDESYATAHKLLVDNIDKLHAMSDALMQYETLDVQQIDAIMEGRKPEPPEGWGSSGGSSTPPQDSASGARSGEQSPGGTIGGPAGEH